MSTFVVDERDYFPLELLVQTDEICLEAVKKNGLLLKYVENKTDEICLEAVKKNGLALWYVRDKTEEMVFVKTQASLPPPALSSCEETRCFDSCETEWFSFRVYS